MIVVVGHPVLRSGNPPTAAGRAAEIALEAAGRGSRVELIGACGDDPDGDVLLIALATAGIGHAATLRDPARRTPVLGFGLGPDDDDAADDDPDPSPFVDEPTPPAANDVARPSLDGADVALGLAYLTSFEVLVVTDDVSPDALPAAIEAAAWSGAHLVLVFAEGASMPAGLPPNSTALAAPGEADDGAFGRLVGAYAAVLDTGASPADAFTAATGAAGWEAFATGA
jgi:hypothetical protein